MGFILVAHDGNGGLRSRKRRHGVGVKKGVNSTYTSGGGHGGGGAGGCEGGGEKIRVVSSKS